MDEASAQQIQLQRDYEEVSRLGLRRAPDDPAQAAALARLVASRLASCEGTFVALQRPEYATVDFPPETLALLHAHYEQWLHAEQLVAGEQVLYGHSGFWQHWWNLLHERSSGTLLMDLVLPDRPELDRAELYGGMRFDLLDEILAYEALRPRIVLPPGEPDGPLSEFVGRLTSRGIEVRVRSSEFLFALYDRAAAVLSTQEHGSEDEGYFLTRRSSIVAPLQRVFDDHWASAIPWESYVRGTADVLALMSLGWTDSRIAEATGLSARTVSRRVADAMAAAGVSSRFELGISYGRAQARREHV